MRKTNRQIFDERPVDQFFKSTKEAKKSFPELKNWPDLIGFDAETNGFLALHFRHSASGLTSEFPVCLILKSLGYAVILIEESPNVGSEDALIGDRKFEIKRLFKASNVQAAIVYHFRAAKHKAERLLLHIDQPIKKEVLKTSIFIAAKKYPTIKMVWIVFEGRLFRFRRSDILARRHEFD